MLSFHCSHTLGHGRATLKFHSVAPWWIYSIMLPCVCAFQLCLCANLCARACFQRSEFISPADWVSLRPEIKLCSLGAQSLCLATGHKVVWFSEKNEACRVSLMATEIAKRQDIVHVWVFSSCVYTCRAPCAFLCVDFSHKLLLLKVKRQRLERREKEGPLVFWGGFAPAAFAKQFSHSSFRVALQADECHLILKASSTLISSRIISPFRSPCEAVVTWTIQLFYFLFLNFVVQDTFCQRYFWVQLQRWAEQTQTLLK